MHSSNLEEDKLEETDVVQPNFGMVVKTYDKREIRNLILNNNIQQEENRIEVMKRDNSGGSMNNLVKEIIDRKREY